MYLQSRKLYFLVSENKCQRPLFSFKLCVCLVTQSYLTLWDPWDCSPPGSSVHEIFQARILEWVAMPSSRGSFWPKDQICASCISCTAGGFFTCWAIAEDQSYHMTQKFYSQIHTPREFKTFSHKDVINLTSYCTAKKTLNKKRDHPQTGRKYLQTMQLTRD